MIESLLVLVVLVVVAYLIVKLSSRTQFNYWCACSAACAWMLGHPIYPAGKEPVLDYLIFS